MFQQSRQRGAKAPSLSPVPTHLTFDTPIAALSIESARDVYSPPAANPASECHLAWTPDDWWPLWIIMLEMLTLVCVVLDMWCVRDELKSPTLHSSLS